jgi:hypothetical protein
MGVSQDPRRRHGQQRRIIKQPRIHGIAKSDINLKGYAGVVKPREEFDTDTFIVLLLLDLFGLHGLFGEIKAIVLNWNSAQFTEDLLTMLNRRIAAAQQIEISGWSMRCAAPHLKKHCPFQNELVSVFRLAEAVEEAFECVARENKTEILAGAGGDIQEPLADGCSDFPGFDRLQVSASMYGLITFVTRQTLAACQRSAVVAFRFLIDSRRASSATSSPILFRYLKQSATVLAMEKMRTGTPST